MRNVRLIRFMYCSLGYLLDIASESFSLIPSMESLTFILDYTHYPLPWGRVPLYQNCKIPLSSCRENDLRQFLAILLVKLFSKDNNIAPY